MLARLPATPLFDSGTQPVLTTHLDDLAALVLALASDARPAPRGPITAAYPETIPFEEVLARLARTQGRAPRFVRIPSFLPLLALKALETLGLRPPIRSDALVGLLATDPKPDFSRTAMSGVAWRRFDG
jgi:nucleoside-diphosphate-sugar epimerase